MKDLAHGYHADHNLRWRGVNARL
ncbi:unnamed protein product [Lathyrus sativus]|nr:unnamed protein product [Lathyrus sativus]